MIYTVKTVHRFEREFKRLAQKYASLKSEFEELVEKLEKNPETGTPLGNSLYKIRLSIASKGRGKSGGARVITYLKTEQRNVYLLSIYDKGKRSTISDNEIREILKNEINNVTL